MQPELDLVLTWGDFVVAQKRVTGGARVVPGEHFAVPDELDAHSLRVRASVAERADRQPRLRLDRAFGLAVLAALLTHVAVGWFGAVSPVDDDGPLTAERLAAIRAASVDQGEHENGSDGSPRAAGTAAPGAFGVAPATSGKPTTTNEDDARADPATFGMIGLLDDLATLPSSGFGAQLGGNASELNGWFEDRGGSGVDLSGIGVGGGGSGSGVALTEVGALGYRCGTGHELQLRGHEARLVCHLHFVDAVVTGHLDAAVIQRIVRQNEGRFRGCYAAGLVSNPALEGRVAVKFAIARDGTVATAEDTPDSELPDAEVRNCVVRAFSSLSFPESRGVVSVTYPIVFSPAD